MRRLLLILTNLLVFGAVSAQKPAGKAQGIQLPPALPLRQVSGTVEDSTRHPIAGASVKLQLTHDTLVTATDAGGNFRFKDVKSATFVLTVSVVGYRTQVRKMLNNDAVPSLKLAPIVLNAENRELHEVVISGAPSIKYKVDTIEYRATDYKVRPNATLDEMLRTMEGFEVGANGSVTHQGQAITKVKLNGKDFAGGGVAQAIQNLPADIIEKVQVVNDYGDQAARSGIKDGTADKILNVTTKASRSIGTTLNLTGQAGNNDRYIGQLSAIRLNANQQLTTIVNLKNTVTGIAPAPVAGINLGGGSPGTTESLWSTVAYRDQYGKNVQVNSSINYGFDRNNSVSQRYGTNYTNSGPSYFNSTGSNQSNSARRGMSFEIDDDLDSLNYLQITPFYNYSTSESYNKSTTDNINKYTSGFEHQLITSNTTSKSPTAQFGLKALFNHRFKKKGRNFSAQFGYQHTDTQSIAENTSDTKNFSDSTTNALQSSGTNNVLSDIPAHLINTKNNSSDMYRISTNYSEPLSNVSRLEFQGQLNENSHNTKNLIDSIGANGVKETNLSYDYATIETRLQFAYRYTGKKLNLAVGTTLSPYSLTGSSFNAAGTTISTSRTDFRVLPIFRLEYACSNFERFSLSYTGSNIEPQFQYLLPFTDNTNPNNVVVGNPYLRPGLDNTISAAYNHFFPESKMNISLNISSTFHTDQIASNVLTILIPLPGTPGSFRSYSETHYVNLNGSRSQFGSYNFSKQLGGIYTIALNGTMSYAYNLAESNNSQYHQTNWDFAEHFGPHIFTKAFMQINPFVGLDLRRTFATSEGSPSTSTLTKSLGLDSRVPITKTFQVHYDVQKQLIGQVVSGLARVNNSPLVIDAGVQKDFGAKQQFSLTFDVFDLLHQNTYIAQSVTATSVTNTMSSSLSRYFLVGFILNLQKWSGTPTSHGKPMQRRGDGSFIY